MGPKHRVLIALLLSVVLLLKGEELVSAFRENIVNVVIHRSFSEADIAAVSRQRAMSLAAGLFRTAPIGSSIELEAAGNLPMISASLRGFYYHRLGDWIRASKWYEVAAVAEPIPERQKQLLVSPWMKLAPTGDFRLEAAAKAWKMRADTPPGAGIARTDRRTLELSCSEVVGDDQKVVLEWNQPFNVPYHHTVVLTAKAEVGTLLIFETVIDGSLVRHFVHRGTGNWEDLSASIEGEHVSYIYLIIRENPDSNVESCDAEFDAISFLLD